MHNFLKRKDRFEFFNSFENPLLNLTFKLETEDFLTYCKSHNLPPFHFFLNINSLLNFLGGTQDKNLPANAGDPDSVPDLGRSHMPGSN